MKKAVAAALVLIAGAAVVLWYGNTLNSWVLGGLIGGLAALLLSIPISLTIFSFLARLHDERRRSDTFTDEESMARYPDHLAAYHDASELYERVDQSAYILYEEDDYIDAEQEELDPQLYVSRQLPAPAKSRLPIVDQDPLPSRHPSQRGMSTNVSGSERLSGRDRDTSQRPASLQGTSAPAFPGYQTPTRSFRSQFQSQALRTARLEAAQQSEGPGMLRPSKPSRRLPIARPGRSLPGSSDRTRASRISRPLSPQSQQRLRPPLSSKSIRRILPVAGESTIHQSYEYADPLQDYADPDMTMKNLKKPLVRRAPYMYEDDPLRRELAQHVDEPTTRRSSRNLSRYQNEE